MEPGGVDDMHCAVCGSDVYGPDLRSVSVVEWNPVTRGNNLLAVLCGDPGCLARWAERRPAKAGE